jgi:L-asparagine transporter-like permease
MYKYVYSILHKYYIGKGEKGFSKVYSICLLTISNIFIFICPFIPYINKYNYDFKQINIVATTFFLLINYIYCIKLNNLDVNYLSTIHEFKTKHKNPQYYFYGYICLCIICFVIMMLNTAIIKYKLVNLTINPQ